MNSSTVIPEESNIISDEPTFSDYFLPFFQGVIFVVAVYVDKFTRKAIWGKKNKQLTRIATMTILTIGLMFLNYSEKCVPEGIDFSSCFYLKYNTKQLLHVFIMNTILFGHHIETLWTFDKFTTHKTFFRTAIFAPLLEQLLFRAVFYRSSSGKVSIVYLSLVFSIFHFHKYIWKKLRGKEKSLAGSLSQLFFTFIFAYYSYYVLDKFQSVIPCIVLHVYCNLIGPPFIGSIKQLLTHLFCAFLFFCYIWFYV